MRNVLQIKDVFDTFCFTVCWEGLRANCAAGTQAAAQLSDDDGDESMDPGRDATEPDLASVRAALATAPTACKRSGLAGKQDALQCAIEQCGTIMRMLLMDDSKQRGKGKHTPAAGLKGALSLSA